MLAAPELPVADVELAPEYPLPGIWQAANTVAHNIVAISRDIDPPEEIDRPCFFQKADARFGS
jgi:hypothetical protein